MAPQSTQTLPTPILLTRPLPQSLRFAAALRGRFGAGIRIVVSPLMAPEFLSVTVPDTLVALILTSETGVEAARRIVADGGALPAPAYCVGDHTAECARDAGFVARSAAGDANALVAAIRADLPQGRLLHLRGRDSRGAVADRLKTYGIEAVEAVAYVQAPQPPTPEAVALLAGTEPLIVALFSARSVALFSALPLLAPLWLACLSPAIAAEGPVAARRVVAVRPDAAAMLDAVGQLLMPGAGA